MVHTGDQTVHRHGFFSTQPGGEGAGAGGGGNVFTPAPPAPGPLAPVGFLIAWQMPFELVTGTFAHASVTVGTDVPVDFDRRVDFYVVDVNGAATAALGSTRVDAQGRVFLNAMFAFEPGQYRIRAVVPQYGWDSFSPFVQVNPNIERLTFAQSPADVGMRSNGTTSNLFDPLIRIQATDSLGVQVHRPNVVVTAALEIGDFTPAGIVYRVAQENEGVLIGTKTANTNINGEAVFNDLAFNTALDVPFRLVMSAPSFPAATSGAFVYQHTLPIAYPSVTVGPGTGSPFTGRADVGYVYTGLVVAFTTVMGQNVPLPDGFVTLSLMRGSSPATSESVQTWTLPVRNGRVLVPDFTIPTDGLYWFQAIYNGADGSTGTFQLVGNMIVGGTPENAALASASWDPVTGVGELHEVATVSLQGVVDGTDFVIEFTEPVKAYLANEGLNQYTPIMSVTDGRVRNMWNPTGVYGYLIYQLEDRMGVHKPLPWRFGLFPTVLPPHRIMNIPTHYNAAGDVLTISGAGLRTATAVRVSAVGAQSPAPPVTLFTVVDDTRINFTVPANWDLLQDRAIIVTLANGTEVWSPQDFQFRGGVGVELTALTPMVAQSGQLVTLSGVNFDTLANLGYVDLIPSPGSSGEFARIATHTALNTQGAMVLRFSAGALAGRYDLSFPIGAGAPVPWRGFYVLR